QRGKLVGDDAYAPAGVVGAGVRLAIRQDFRGSIGLAPFAKRAEAPGLDGLDATVVLRALGAIGGDDHPAPDDGVLTQVRHDPSSQFGSKLPLRLQEDKETRRKGDKEQRAFAPFFSLSPRLPGSLVFLQLADRSATRLTLAT